MQLCTVHKTYMHVVVDDIDTAIETCSSYFCIVFECSLEALHIIHVLCQQKQNWFCYW